MILTPKKIGGPFEVERSARGDVTPEKAYFGPILNTLLRLGGRGGVPDVIAAVGGILQAQFTDTDRELLAATGKMRWQNRAAWPRQQLVDLGLLLPKAQQGVWEISAAGRRWLQEHGVDDDAQPG